MNRKKKLLCLLLISAPLVALSFLPVDIKHPDLIGYAVPALLAILEIKNDDSNDDKHDKQK